MNVIVKLASYLLVNTLIAWIFPPRLGFEGTYGGLWGAIIGNVDGAQVAGNFILSRFDQAHPWIAGAIDGSSAALPIAYKVGFGIGALFSANVVLGFFKTEE